MKLCANGWVPDDESDAAILFGGVSYQSFKLKHAMKHVKNRRTAIDVGAHCGLWTAQLADLFEKVECFEPLSMHIECWQRNVGLKRNCILHEVALGERIDTCGMKIVESYSGRSHISDDGPYHMVKLDDFEFEDVDLIKIDVEGYEYFVIRGGENTILQNKPVMIVEQKPGHGERYGLSQKHAIDHLEKLGAHVKEEISGDYIVGWE